MQPLLLLLAGAAFGMLMLIGQGANDVANAFATSVGSKALSLRGAIAIAAVMEFSGAVLMGHLVSDTIANLATMECHGDDAIVVMYIMTTGLIGVTTWLYLATLLNLPVSSSHAVISSVVGSIAAVNVSCVEYQSLISIVVSWFVSPVLAGLIGASIFMLVKHVILDSSKPLRNALAMFPLFCGFTMFVISFVIVFKGVKGLAELITPWGSVLLCIALGLLVMLMVYCCIVPHLRRRTFTRLNALAAANDEVELQERDMPVQEFDTGGASDYNTPSGSESDGRDNAIDEALKEFGDFSSNPVVDQVSEGASLSSDKILSSSQERAKQQETDEAEALFSTLQVLAATLTSFAHGANDTANAVGPFVAIWSLYKTKDLGQEAPIWVYAVGGFGSVLGLALFGYRVIRTMGERITNITYSRGFCIQIAAMFSVVLATRFGLPVSTTHCQVGATIFVGAVGGSKAVDWKLFGAIVASWVITVPFSFLVSYALMWVVKAAALN